MSEHSKRETETIANIFADAYNKSNNTNFSWDDIRSYQPGEPYDFKLFSEKKELGAQIVRAVGDSNREYIRPKQCDKVVDALRKQLEANSSVPSISVYLNFYNPPKNQEEIDDAIYWLEFFIREKAVNGWRVGYFSYNDNFDGTYLKEITKWVDDIDIAPINSDKKNIRFIYGSSKKEIEPLVRDEDRVSMAVEKKSGKYNDIILVVDSGTMPISDFCIPIIKNRLSTSKFKEIWTVDNFLSHRRAERIK